VRCSGATTTEVELAAPVVVTVVDWQNAGDEIVSAAIVARYANFIVPLLMVDLAKWQIRNSGEN
jgi:hypothetical protein